MTRVKPSPREQETLDFIRHSLDTRGIPPSCSELEEHLGVVTARVFQLLNGLERKGYLTRERGSHRTIRLVDQAPDRYKIPVLGHVEAGRPTGDLATHVYVDRFYLQDVTPGRVYALAVVGDDLAAYGVRDGDFVICHAQSTAADGDVSIPVPADGVSVVGDPPGEDPGLVGVVVGVYRSTD